MKRTGHANRVLAVSVLMVLTGCSSGSSPARSSGTAGVSSTRSGTGTPSSASAAAVPPTASDGTAEQVLVAYRGYWAARVTAQGAPDEPVPPGLEMYAIDRARTDVEASILRFRQQGIAFRGQPVLSPRVTVMGVGTQARASIGDCVDSSHWTPVFTATGASALAPGQPLRVVVDSTARLFVGHWVIDSSVAHRDQPC